MQGKDARAEYLAQHIPGAVFFDLDDISDTNSSLPHMLPPPEKFASRVRRLGIGDGNRIVVYDANNMSAARVWWMFRIFGAREVAILDGGLAKWLAEGRPVEDGEVKLQERHFTARLDNTQVRSKEQMRRNIDSKREQALDARAAGRFHATEPELWPGRRVRPYPRRAQPALQPAVQRRRQLQGRRHAARPLRERRHRPEEAGRDLLRLRHHGLRPRLRAAPDRPPRCRGL